MAEAVAAETGAADAAEGTQAAPSGFDLGPVLERFDGLESGLGGRISQIEQMLTAEEPEGPDDNEFDLSSLLGEDAAGVDPQALEQAFGQYDSRAQQQLQTAIEQATAPLTQQLRELQVGRDMEALAARYPDLDNVEIARPVVDAAKELAEALGNPDIAVNSKVLETIYKAQMADKYAAGEVPVGGQQQVELERAGGAGPAATEPNIADRLIAQRKGGEFWRMGG
jgi:hypothetical protein